MADKVKPLNPKTTSYEWFGPIGATFIIQGLPLAVLGINTACSRRSCSITDASLSSLQDLALDVRSSIEVLPQALLWELLWILFHCIIYLLPIGPRGEGMKLRNGKVLTYNLNAIHAMVISYACAFGAHYFGFFNLGRLADMFYPLAVGALIISTTLALLLYIASFRSSNVLLAEGGNSGNMMYDFWVGRELNPRIGALDLKFMFELRPGLIGWTLLSWSFVINSYQNGNLTPSLPLVAFFQTWYVADGLWFEAGNMTMMDIVYDGFGFMLAFGDLAWVPFLYTLQCKFLNMYPAHLSNLYILGCVALHFVGYSVFRGANSQKDRFRRDPKDPRVQHLKVMKTSAGKSLIISGFWGICRHPNYVGDWFMTLSWSLLTGTSTALPYFQPIYFAILLIHRQLRDEEQMVRKYGEEDWKKFCEQVKYRLIPFVY